MGKYSHLNQAMGLTIGHEFGCGIGTKVFTHGAYESILDGFPVQGGSVKIGNKVWIPNAWVNPGITIGNNVVIAAMSLVNKDIPSRCLAGGIPIKILKEDVYPRDFNDLERIQMLKDILVQFQGIKIVANGIIVGDTFFDVSAKCITGIANDRTEAMKNQLRRNGIRFRYYNKNGVYEVWDD